MLQNVSIAHASINERDVAIPHWNPQSHPLNPFQCSEAEQFYVNGCLPKCTGGKIRLDSTLQCICPSGQFWNSSTLLCQWCPDSATSSIEPRTHVRHCLCISGYIWSNSKQSCLLGLSALSPPNVSFSTDIEYSIGASISIATLGLFEFALQHHNKSWDYSEEIFLHFQVWNGPFEVMNVKISSIFNSSSTVVLPTAKRGNYSLRVAYEGDRSAATPFSISYYVYGTANIPFIYPPSGVLHHPSILLLSSRENLNYPVYYKLNRDKTWKIYDVHIPPIVVAGTFVEANVRPPNYTRLYRSDILSTQYTHSPQNSTTVNIFLATIGYMEKIASGTSIATTCIILALALSLFFLASLLVIVVIWCTFRECKRNNESNSVRELQKQIEAITRRRYSTRRSKRFSLNKQRTRTSKRFSLHKQLN